MKPNKYGCKVSEDVCLIHTEPLLCKHGCSEQIYKSCKCEVTYDSKPPYDAIPRWPEPAQREQDHG